MTKRMRSTGFISILLCTLVTFAAGQPSQSPKDNPHTAIKLLADVQSLKPGSQFTLGLLMTMDEGWHTYWKNPGDAGLPTRLKWTLPEGLTAGDIIWPAPHKYIEGGEVLAYGYEKENMLLIPITVSASLSEASNLVIKVKADWLECEAVCIPGSGTAELTLPVRSTNPTPANEKIFSVYRKLVPAISMEGSNLLISSTLLPGLAEITVTPQGGAKLVVAQGMLPDFYPETIEGMAIGRTTVINDGTTLRIPLSSFEPISGERMLKGIVVYQFEGEERRTVEYSISLPADYIAKLPVEGEGGSSGSVLDRTFETVNTPGSEQSLFFYILFAIIGGLLLNIMPCVLPVIALKVFGLVKMGGDAPARVRKLGWFFSLGVLVSFLTLATIVIILQTAGEQVGWGFQFQEPAFVIAMCAVVFVFGLSLFGVFEIQLPSAAVEGVGKVVAAQEREGKGYGASFWEGVFATILATPCTAPFLGTALGFAFAQPWWVILLIFSCVAFGMSLPYLVLTTKPSWTKFLPKPGEWMVTAKQFMGFLMMATLLWLLYVLGKQLGMEGVIWTCAFLLMAGVAFWLVGRFATLTATRAKCALTWSIAGVLIIIGYMLFLRPVFEAQSAVAGSNNNGVSREVNGIAWEPFTVEKLDAALKDNKSVFIDFTAEWCLTCKVNEKTVLADRDVIEKFKTSSILAMKADWTNRNAEITALLSKFGRSGVPLYVVFPAGKPNAPIVLPEVITSAIVIEAIDKATSTVGAAG